MDLEKIKLSKKGIETVYEIVDSQARTDVETINERLDLLDLEYLFRDTHNYAKDFEPIEFTGNTTPMPYNYNVVVPKGKYSLFLNVNGLSEGCQISLTYHLANEGGRHAVSITENGLAKIDFELSEDATTHNPLLIHVTIVINDRQSHTITVDSWGLRDNTYLSLLGDGGGDTNSRELTLAEYDSLSEEEKLNGTVYYVKDSDNIPPVKNPITTFKSDDNYLGITIVSDRTNNLHAKGCKSGNMISYLLTYQTGMSFRPASGQYYKIGTIENYKPYHEVTTMLYRNDYNTEHTQIRILPSGEIGIYGEYLSNGVVLKGSLCYICKED